MRNSNLQPPTERGWRKRRFLAGVLVVWYPVMAQAQSDSAADSLSAPPVDSLVAEALRNNPSLQAARNRQTVSEGGIRRAGAFDAPILGVEIGQRVIAPGEAMAMNGFFARQMIEFPGKVSAMKAAETLRAAMNGFEAESQGDKIARAVRNGYYELYLLQRQGDLNADNLKVMEKFVGAARTQYEAGMGKMEEVLRAQTELSRLRSDALVLRQQRLGMEAMLNAWLNRSGASRLGRIADLSEAAAPDFSPDTLVAWAWRNRPDLQAMEADRHMQEWEAAAARRQAYPDLMLEGKWMPVMGPDEWSVMAGITVPLAPWSWGNFAGARVQGRARLREAENRQRDMKNMVAAEVRQAWAKVEAAESRRALARDATIPQAEQTLLSTESAYRSGKTEFLMLLDAYRMVFTAREEFYMAQSEFHQGWSELENALGQPLRLSDSTTGNPGSRPGGLP